MSKKISDLPFAQIVIKKLQRFHECMDDGQGADIGREWFDILTKLGLLNRVQRSPGLWEITDQGDEVLAAAEQAERATKPRVSEEQWTALDEAKKSIENIEASRKERAERFGLSDANAEFEIGYIQHSQAVQYEGCQVDSKLIWTMPSDQRHKIPQNYKVMCRPWKSE